MFGGARPTHDAGKLARVLESTDEEMMRQFAAADQRRTEPDLGTHIEARPCPVRGAQYVPLCSACQSSDE
jgi:hypothetical protein